MTSRKTGSPTLKKCLTTSGYRSSGNGLVGLSTCGTRCGQLAQSFGSALPRLCMITSLVGLADSVRIRLDHCWFGENRRRTPLTAHFRETTNEGSEETMLNDRENRAALVTGGLRGLGRAMSLGLARA